MIYVIKNTEGVTEVREDQYPLANGAVEITEQQKQGLIEGSLQFENGEIIETQAQQGV
jgi:hypothetical protein